MVYRGLVLSLGKDYAVVMTDETEYMKVNKKAGLAVGKRILFLDEDVYREKRTARLYLIKCAAVFAIILLASMFQLYLNEAGRAEKTVAAVVTIDINPSIEIGINKKGTVVSLTSLNDEGAGISNSVMIGKNIDTVLSELLENADAKEYFSNGENYILISLTALTDDLNIDLSDIRTSVNRVIDGRHKPETIDIVYACGNKDILLEARQNRISAGRYFYYEELKKSEPQITIETVRNMKLRDLFGRQRYRQRYGDPSEAPEGAQELRQLTDNENEYEHILQRKQSNTVVIEERTITGTNEGGQGNNKESVSQNRYRNAENKQAEPGGNDDPGQRAQIVDSTGEQQQTPSEPEAQQNKPQEQSGMFEENTEPSAPQHKKPDREEPKESSKSEKGSKSDKGRRH